MKQAIQPLLDKVLLELGVDLTDEETMDTPARWAKWLVEFAPKTTPPPGMKVFPNKDNYTGVVYDRCEIYSLCSHHMLPVHGTAHLAYIPSDRLLGLSKLSRIADWYARQPTTQESLTQTIASYIQVVTDATGVAVTIEARHFCKCMRGVAKQDGLMVTTKLLGAFFDNPAAHTEFIHYTERRSNGY